MSFRCFGIAFVGALKWGGGELHCYSLSRELMKLTVEFMPHSHYTGTGMGPESTVSFVLIQFPLPVPVPVQCSVNKPL